MGRKLIRYRKPSVKTMLGVTKAKRRLKQQTGYYAATKPLRAKKNFERRMKRKMGYYSEPMKALRAAKHGNLYVGPVQVSGKSSKTKAQRVITVPQDAKIIRVDFGIRNRPHERKLKKRIKRWTARGYDLFGYEHKTHNFFVRLFTLRLKRSHTLLYFTKAT